MRYHPGHIDAQQHDAEWAAHATSEHTSDHSQREHDRERHIQQEDGAVSELHFQFYTGPLYRADQLSVWKSPEQQNPHTPQPPCIAASSGNGVCHVSAIMALFGQEEEPDMTR